MKITVTKSQLKQLVKEEANRYRRVIELNNKKKEIVKQLDELYEMDMVSPGTPGMADESWLGDIGKNIKGAFQGGTRDEWRERFINWMMRNQQNHPNSNIQIPQGADLEAAVDAVIKHGDVRVVKRNGQWLPITKISSSTGAGFDSGGLFEEKGKKK